MTELNPLAVQNVGLLRELIKDGSDRPANVAELARRLERDESNVRKTIKTLGGEGLLFANTLRLSGSGIEQVEAIDRAEGRAFDADTALSPGAAVALSDGMLALRHDQILPDPDNARQDWDSEEAQAELAALHDDIVKNGLLQNLVVRRMAADDLQDNTITVTDAAGVEQTLPLYRLVAGERRWRAVDIAIGDGDWSVDTPILARLLDTDPKELRFAAIAENLLRRKLNPIEKATGFEQLAEVGFANKDMAERLGFTPEHVQQHRRFLKLDVADQQRMTLPKDDPKHLSVRSARELLSNADAKAAKLAEIDAVPAAERMLAAEIAHAILARTNGSYGDLIVHGDRAEDPLFASLVERDWFRDGGLYAWGGEKLGHFTVSRGYSLPYDAFGWFFGGDQDKRDAGLRAAQAAAGHPDAEGYLTAWLAPDPARTPEGQAMYDNAMAEAKQRDANERDRLAKVEAAQERIREARRRHAFILNASHEKAAAGAPEENQAIAVDLDRPLPWRIQGGEILAANDKTVRRISGGYGGPSDHEMVVAQMTVVAVNTAGGLATPATPPEDDDTPDRDAFTGDLETALQRLDPSLEDDEAADLAWTVLDDFLTGNSIAFGAEGFDWTESGALALAEQHASDAQDTSAEDEAA